MISIGDVKNDGMAGDKEPAWRQAWQAGNNIKNGVNVWQQCVRQR